MKLSALAEASGTSVASIKYYLRIGLLPPGEKRNATTALYHDSHLERLQLIAALRGIVGLPIEAIATLTGVIDDPDAGILDVMETAQILASGLEPQGTPPTQEQLAQEPLVAKVLESRGWPDHGSAARHAVGAVLADLARLGLPVTEEYLDTVSAAMDTISAASLDLSGSRDAIAIHVAVGTHQYTRLTVALLQLAHTSHSILGFTSGQDGTMGA